MHCQELEGRTVNNRVEFHMRVKHSDKRVDGVALGLEKQASRKSNRGEKYRFHSRYHDGSYQSEQT